MTGSALFPAHQFFTIPGTDAAAAGYQLFTYQAGTSTKEDTFTTSSGAVANSNPIVLDVDGTPPNGIYGTDGTAYKIVLAPPTDTDPPASGVTLADNYETGDNLAADLASTATDDGTKGFHLVYYPLQGWETAVNIQAYEYPWKHILRYIPKTEHAAMRDGTVTADLSTYITNWLADAQDDDELIVESGLTIPFGNVTVQDKENIKIDFNNSTIKAIAGTPAFLLKMENTTSSFKRGWHVQNVLCTGTCTAFFHIEGGAWSNFKWERVFSDDGVATYLIYHNNATSPVRNPSNFEFNTIWNKSFDIRYCIYYNAVAGANSDNFSYDHILHWSNQATPSTIYFNGAGTLYSEFQNVYGALYATGAAVIGTAAAATVTRSTIKGVLMEGAQDGRETLAGNYLECEIRNIVNFYDEATYNTNYAINAKVQFSQVFNALLQTSAGPYSTLPAVILQANSVNNLLTSCHTVTDNGSLNRVVGLPWPPAYGVKQRQSYTTVGTKDLITLTPADFAAGDIIVIDMVGDTTGAANKTVELFETGVRSLGVIGSTFTAQSFSARITYTCWDNAGTLSVECQVIGYYGTTIGLHNTLGSRAFTSNIIVALNLSGGVAPGETVELKNAKATLESSP